LYGAKTISQLKVKLDVYEIIKAKSKNANNPKTRSIDPKKSNHRRIRRKRRKKLDIAIIAAKKIISVLCVLRKRRVCDVSNVRMGTLQLIVHCA